MQRRSFARIMVTAPLTAPLLAACEEMTGSDQGELRIRVRNTGTADLTGVVIGYPFQTVEYGDVAAGEATNYVAVGQAYAYAAVRVGYNGEEITRTPIDYVGEEPLDPGRWTFELSIDLAGPYLIQRMVRG